MQPQRFSTNIYSQGDLTAKVLFLKWFVYHIVYNIRSYSYSDRSCICVMIIINVLAEATTTGCTIHNRGWKQNAGAILESFSP